MAKPAKIQANVRKRVKLVSRLKTLYREEIIKKCMEKFGYKNQLEVPRLEKVVLSMGLGGRDLQRNLTDLTLIAGQKAVLTKARISVAQFSVRQGSDVGAKVTIRGNNMYHFLDRLVNIAFLNWRSFSGINSKSVNKQKSNLSISFGIPDKKIFAEVSDDSIRSEGLNITIISNCKNSEELCFLLQEFGFPFSDR